MSPFLHDVYSATYNINNIHPFSWAHSVSFHNLIDINKYTIGAEIIRYHDTAK